MISLTIQHASERIRPSRPAVPAWVLPRIDFHYRLCEAFRISSALLSTVATHLHRQQGVGFSLSVMQHSERSLHLPPTPRDTHDSSAPRTSVSTAATILRAVPTLDAFLYSHLSIMDTIPSTQLAARGTHRPQLLDSGALCSDLSGVKRTLWRELTAIASASAGEDIHVGANYVSFSESSTLVFTLKSQHIWDFNCTLKHRPTLHAKRETCQFHHANFYPNYLKGNHHSRHLR
ncbi:hypothetical protein MSAN_01320600 [Mycena sanguinolenta]|uniref:Uncharacterized protein n=1 Tax=Mycena sanguinolenta TaxID=230812 RepID=A0A8H6YE05_9AGAR|nr:hypothetical protein MSAN_01320600 [Mycena sanguinolenta]